MNVIFLDDTGYELGTFKLDYIPRRGDTVYIGTEYTVDGVALYPDQNLVYVFLKDFIRNHEPSINNNNGAQLSATINLLRTSINEAVADIKSVKRSLANLKNSSRS